MNETKSGKFSRETTDRQDAVQSIIDRDLDWISTKGKIFIRCWETPKEFTIVEADIIWTSKMYTVK